MGSKKRKAKRRAGTSGADPRLAAAALFVVAAGLYLNTLGHGFVFDDGALILQNPAVTDFTWSQMFTAGSYRPVRTLTYALNYALGGEDPWGYHLLNLLLHALNSVLLFRLLTEWSAGVGAAFAGGLVFAAHPVQTAAVAYISGRKDLLATGFILAALICYTRYRREGGGGRLAATLALALLAILSKEVALIFPGLLLLVEAVVLPSDTSRPWTARAAESLKRLGLPLGAALALAAAGLLHAIYISEATRMSGFWGGSPSANLGTTFKLFAHYLKLVFWPRPLIADYKGEVFPVSTGLTEPATVIAALILAGFVVLAARQLLHRNLAGLGMGWFLLALLPVLQLIPFHEIAADHFLYLPMAGTAATVTHLFGRVALRFKTPAWGALVVLCLAYAAVTVDRNRDWKDARALWEATYAVAPGSYRANTNLGPMYFGQPGRRAEALEMTRRATQLAPEDAAAASNVGAMELLLAREAAAGGDPQKAWELAQSARESLEAALRLRRGDGSILSNLGSVHRVLATLAEGRGDRQAAREHRRAAIQNFRWALKRDRRREVKAAWYNLGLVYFDLHRYQDAASSFENFLEVQPNHADAHLQLGFCRILLRDYPGAVDQLETSLRLRPSPQGFNLLAAAHQFQGQLERAEAICRQGLQLFPATPSLVDRLNQLTG